MVSWLTNTACRNIIKQWSTTIGWPGLCFWIIAIKQKWKGELAVRMFHLSVISFARRV